jgi:type I restriction enzyme R subunit
MSNQNPEQIARDNIDAQLEACGWLVQNMSQLNLNAGLGVAVREYLTDAGPADYVLFVDGKPCGIIEAKREEEGQKLTVHDVTWIKDKSLTDLDNLPDPDILATEIIDNLKSGIESFEEIMLTINGK